MFGFLNRTKEKAKVPQQPAALLLISRTKRKKESWTCLVTWTSWFESSSLAVGRQPASLRVTILFWTSYWIIQSSTSEVLPQTFYCKCSYIVGLFLLFLFIFLQDPEDSFKLSEDTRQLGLVVCRGTAVVLICPADGMEAIPNPFIQPE